MSRIPRRLLALALLALLALSLLPSALSFNPYEDEDDVGSGDVPATSTVECRQVDGNEVCESVAKVVPDEAALEAAMVKAEAERIALAEAKAAKRKKMADEGEAKRAAKRAAKAEAEKKRLEAEGGHEEGKKKHKGPNSGDYEKLADPLKKLKVDYYKYFGVERDATKLQIRKVVNNFASANHPDKCPTPACKEKMVVINAARDVLLNDETREQYDFLLRFGFKVYDKELYDDMLEQYKKDPDDMPDGFGDDEGYDPASDPFESMVLTHESAGWLLLFTGTVTLGLLAWPIVKFWEKSQTAEARKAALKKEMLEKQKLGIQAQEHSSFKKKDQRFTGDKTVKRSELAASPSPSASPRASPSPKASSSPKAVAAVTLLCVLSVLALAAPVAATAQSYYDLLEVASNVDAAGLKKA
jgi:curved DNA-binding protein CbpA